MQRQSLADNIQYYSIQLHTMELFSCKVSAYFIGHYRTVAVLCLDSGVVFAPEKYVLNVNEFCQCMLHLAHEGVAAPPTFYCQQFLAISNASAQADDTIYFNKCIACVLMLSPLIRNTRKCGLFAPHIFSVCYPSALCMHMEGKRLSQQFTTLVSTYRRMLEYQQLL